MRDKDTLLRLIEVRLEGLANDQYASKKMGQQAARDALKDLNALKLLEGGSEAAQQIGEQALERVKAGKDDVVEDGILLDPIHPGEVLYEEFMKPLRLNAEVLAAALGLKNSQVSDIIMYRRPITAEIALRLGKYFGTSPEIWIGLQNDFDLRIARREYGASIDNVKARSDK